MERKVRRRDCACYMSTEILPRYRTLADRLLQMSLVPSRRSVKRDVSYEFMNRQMVWHAFTVRRLSCFPCFDSQNLCLGILVVPIAPHQRKSNPPTTVSSHLFLQHLFPILCNTIPTPSWVIFREEKYDCTPKTWQILGTVRRPMRHLCGECTIQPQSLGRQQSIHISSNKS